MSDGRIHLGKKGEDLATHFLVNSGYTIHLRNYRTKNGEIDIIAKEGPILTFVEVKTRKSTLAGSPFDSITYKKQQAISRVAQEYISRNRLFSMDARFDVISVIIEKGKEPQIELIKNAFDFCFG